VRRTVTVLVWVRVLRTVNVESVSAEPAGPACPAEPAEPACPAEPAGPAEPAFSAEPAEPADPAPPAPEATAGFSAMDTGDAGSGANGTAVWGATIATEEAAADAAAEGEFERDAASLLAALKAEEREETWETLAWELTADEMAALAEMFMTAIAKTPLY
jgi:hypothetical protein